MLKRRRHEAGGGRSKKVEVLARGSKPVTPCEGQGEVVEGRPTTYVDQSRSPSERSLMENHSEEEEEEVGNEFRHPPPTPQKTRRMTVGEEIVVNGEE